MQVIDGIPVWGDPLPEAVEQMKAVMNYEGKKPEYVALMADHHIGYSVPVGGVVAYEGAICVNGVGYDIACGNKAVLLDCDAKEVKPNIYRNMNEIQKHISFGIGRRNNEKVENPQLTQGLVRRDEHDSWIQKVGVEVRGGGLDESPYAYKRIERVLESHVCTIKILHTLTPIGVCMADEREKDPYKD